MLSYDCYYHLLLTTYLYIPTTYYILLLITYSYYLLLLYTLTIYSYYLLLLPTIYYLLLIFTAHFYRKVDAYPTPISTGIHRVVFKPRCIYMVLLICPWRYPV